MLRIIFQSFFDIFKCGRRVLLGLVYESRVVVDRGGVGAQVVREMQVARRLREMSLLEVVHAAEGGGKHARLSRRQPSGDARRRLCRGGSEATGIARIERQNWAGGFDLSSRRNIRLGRRIDLWRPDDHSPASARGR